MCRGNICKTEQVLCLEQKTEGVLDGDSEMKTAG